DDAGGDANDHAGAYVRFNGQSGVPTENDYYFVRIDAGGDSSSVTLHKVKDGVHELLISAQDEPFVIREGDTVTLNVRAAGNEIFVSIDDLEVVGMNPFTDEFEPLLGCGRVGVGQNTHPAYFDDFVIVNEDNAPCPCVVTRELSSRRYQPGEAVTATLRTRNLTGATTITETFTNGLSVTNDGGGNVNGNTISFDLAADGEVSYQLTAPDGFCQDVNFTGTMTGAGGCDTTVGGDGSLVCFEVPVGTLVLNFDDDPPTLTGELPDFFDFLGFDDTGWRVEDNLQNPANGSQALHTTSDGGRLQNYFSRVAVLKQDLFNAQDLSYSLEITWDDMGGNADDHAGAYFRFHGESDEPLENEYYFVRIDAGGDSSRVALHRVKGGRQQRLAQVSDAPRIVREGDTILLTIEAVGNEISVSIDGQAVPGMDPYVDDDPLLACGRVGVGQDTNPAYFDEITVTSRDEFPCPCVARRTLSTRRIQGGDTVAVTVRARDLGGASTITETFPTDWAVTNQGGGTVAGNTIAFDLAADGEVSYELEVPDGFCDAASVTGTIAGAGGCQGDVAGDSRLVCVETEGALVLDFDTTEPLTGADLPDFFTFFGFDKDIWSIEPNLQDRRNDTNALHTTSDGNQLANFFSRVAILRPEVFEAENFVYSVDVTFDDLSGDADDHAGVYFRFQGETDDGLANDYYFLRIDAGGTSSSINLHRVKDGLEQRVARVTNDPFTIVEGDTVTLTVRAEGDMISVFVDGLPVPNLSPYLDFDPITGCGAVGVGEQTNPTYFDDFALISLDETPCPCAASRQFSSLIYTPGDRVAVTVKARNITGATTLTETFPDGWAVASAGGGTVNGNTIRFDRTADGEVAYELDVPGDFCGAAGFSGTLTGAGDCDVEVGGKSGIRCIFGCGELQESGAVSEMLMIGPIDLGGNTGPNCDDNGNLEFTDYLTDGVTDETNLEVIFGDEVQPDFFGAAGGFGVGFSPNPD
ncbi:MAG: hypothetical protein O7J95_13085, partial [Planctomycetota bacterium]|nr:hypothetical protein [Planctomycetota bacterium]